MNAPWLAPLALVAGCSTTGGIARDDARAPPGRSVTACHEGFQPSGDDRADVTRLARACGAVARLGPTRTVTQTADTPVTRFTFAASGGDCYRVFAVGGDGVVELDAMLRGPDGRPLARDDDSGGVAVAPLAASLCAPRDDTYAVDVAVTRGSGRFSVELWRQ
ncbi:MAG: hypothetical protein IT374_12335 [Polyangiaceae bacterium]|nr:hypothetical protein [Polyangiaceae bacterium]